MGARGMKSNSFREAAFFPKFYDMNYGYYRKDGGEPIKYERDDGNPFSSRYDASGALSNRIVCHHWCLKVNVADTTLRQRILHDGPSLIPYIIGNRYIKLADRMKWRQNRTYAVRTGY